MSYAPCIFEYIYLARPDSILDGVPIHQVRTNMGESLARKILLERPNHNIDVIIPIPDTSRNAAQALARILNIPYSEGFVKNRYIGRTFIMSGQTMRKSSVRLKLNAIKAEFIGKTILLVDDSIVRGTTSKEIIQMARDSGAKNVYFASAAPEVRYPNVYGIDMPTVDELIAHDTSNKAIMRLIGADWLIFQNLKDVYQAINDAIGSNKSKIERFEDSIFTGNYITGGVTKEYLTELADSRNDTTKMKNRVLNELYSAVDFYK